MSDSVIYSPLWGLWDFSPENAKQLPGFSCPLETVEGDVLRVAVGGGQWRLLGVIRGEYVVWDKQVGVIDDGLMLANGYGL